MDFDAGALRCPSCGAPCSPDVRVCPHCDVEIASVRCGHCFALHFAGSQFCARCGKELALEPVLDAVDAPCPRCNHPLSASTGGAIPAQQGNGIYECTGCGGMFVDASTLERVLARETRPRVSPPGSVRSTPPRGASHAPGPVRYLHCPVCATLMNRVHFARHSGVIVNVCKDHGTWFDTGELTTVIELVRAGIEDA